MKPSGGASKHTPENRRAEKTASTSSSGRRGKGGTRNQQPDPPVPFTTGGDGSQPSNNWNLRLYVAGETLRSRAAIENLKKICETYLKEDYTIEVIDLAKNPSLARGDQIVALPTLVRKIPVPMRKIIGDLSNIERVLVGLDIQPRKGT